MEDLTPSLIRRHLDRGLPLLTGLSSTALYRSARELPDGEYDSVRGEPQGHFVLLSGYDRAAREVLVADPLGQSPAQGLRYRLSLHRVINAILLGIMTYDGNLLVLEPQA